MGGNRDEFLDGIMKRDAVRKFFEAEAESETQSEKEKPEPKLSVLTVTLDGTSSELNMDQLSEHHTPEQVQKAFQYAPVLLRKLKEAGLQFPSIQLYEDASGTLILGSQKEVTDEQAELASTLIYSRRGTSFGDNVGIRFCCGLVKAAEEAEHEQRGTVMYATDIKTLVYYDGPQVVRLETTENHTVIAVALPTLRGAYSGMIHPFLAAEITDHQWESYEDGEIDLRELFVNPGWRRWYLFDLGEETDVLDRTAMFRVGEDVYRNPDYLPDPGFLAENHTEKEPE